MQYKMGPLEPHLRPVPALPQEMLPLKVPNPSGLEESCKDPGPTPLSETALGKNA